MADRVYVVKESNGYEIYGIVGVYSSREQAEKLIEPLNRDEDCWNDYIIEECELDNLNSNEYLLCIHLSYNGEEFDLSVRLEYTNSGIGGNQDRYSAEYGFDIYRSYKKDIDIDKEIYRLKKYCCDKWGEIKYYKSIGYSDDKIKDMINK